MITLLPRFEVLLQSKLVRQCLFTATEKSGHHNSIGAFFLLNLSRLLVALQPRDFVIILYQTMGTTSLQAQPLFASLQNCTAENHDAVRQDAASTMEQHHENSLYMMSRIAICTILFVIVMGADSLYNLACLWYQSRLAMQASPNQLHQAVRTLHDLTRRERRKLIERCLQDQTLEIKIPPPKPETSSFMPGYLLRPQEAAHGNRRRAISDESHLERCCAICLVDYEGGDVVSTSLKCPHIFHKNCIVSWLDDHTTCPCCRNDLIPSDFEETCGSEDSLASTTVLQRQTPEIVRLDETEDQQARPSPEEDGWGWFVLSERT